MSMRPRGSPAKLANAREMRKEPTEAERRVWRLIRSRQVHGLKFRRQAVIAGFIADFYCAELKLILELDGSFHENQEIHDYDQARDEATFVAINRIVAAHLGTSSTLSGGT
jgi:very-short-patch-repair endonuclease